MSHIENSVIPIKAGYSDGNGVVVGNLFITAGHVANKGESLQININGDFYSLNKQDALLCLEEDRKEDGLFNDCAIYKLPKSYNNLSISRTIPDIGSVLNSVSIKHVVKTPTPLLTCFFTTCLILTLFNMLPMSGMVRLIDKLL